MTDDFFFFFSFSIHKYEFMTIGEICWDVFAKSSVKGGFG